MLAFNYIMQKILDPRNERSPRFLTSIYISEISFLRLVHMDLSANRITTLPVELRFMNTVVDLSLGENPLSCPPANVSTISPLNSVLLFKM